MTTLSSPDRYMTFGMQLLVTLGFLLLYPIGIVIYNLYFHPLAKYPGPKLWAAFRLPFIRSLWKGALVHDVQKIHERYGDIVRLAPNEISFAKPEAWNDIFLHRKGHLPFPKNPVWWSSNPGQPQSILAVKDAGDHARMRKLLSYGFVEKALRAQEPLMASYVDLLIARLREKATAPETKASGVVLDIVQWYNYTTFDIIGDLCLGQSFNCLQDRALHPWVALIFSHFKASSFMASVRFYPILSSLLRQCIPKSVMKKQQAHFQFAVDRIDRRMNMETQRDDIMTDVLQNNSKGDMTVGEIRATFNILLIAGSETTATVLSGITNYLVQNRSVLVVLVNEIRRSFRSDAEINLDTVQKLPYLNAVIEEGLRLCPPVPAGLPRIVPAGGDTVCGEWLPEYTNVSVHQWTLANSPECFVRPTSFVPERWLSPEAPEFASDRRSASQPFSLGPRSCIGKNLAYAEMRLILARLLWNFDIAVPNEGQKVMSWASQKTYVLVEKQPFEIRLKYVGE